MFPFDAAANARQMRCTVETDKPQARAMPRELQCVASGGTRSSVCTTIASIRASSILRGVPDRGSSRKPSRRCSAKRRRHHLPTVGSSTPQLGSHDLVLLAFGATQHNRGPQRDGLRRLAPRRQQSQLNLAPHRLKPMPQAAVQPSPSTNCCHR
jgi:hypothetical protein